MLQLFGYHPLNYNPLLLLRFYSCGLLPCCYGPLHVRLYRVECRRKVLVLQFYSFEVDRSTTAFFMHTSFFCVHPEATLVVKAKEPFPFWSYSLPQLCGGCWPRCLRPHCAGPSPPAPRCHPLCPRQLQCRHHLRGCVVAAIVTQSNAACSGRGRRDKRITPQRKGSRCKSAHATPVISSGSSN